MKLKENIFTKPASKFRTTFAQAKQDENGVAAIEFSIIAPILIMMYFGIAELATAISIDRRVSQGASVAGDIATQSETLDLAEVEELLSAAIRVMNVPHPEKIYLDIESLMMRSSDGAARSKARIQLNMSNKVIASYKDKAADLDPRIFNTDSGIVVARVKYLYTPLKLRFFDSDISLQETFLLKPRKSKLLEFSMTGVTRVTCTSNNYATVTCQEFGATAS